MLKSDIEKKINGLRNQLGQIIQQRDNLNNQVRFLTEESLKIIGKIQAYEEIKEEAGEIIVAETKTNDKDS